MTRLRLVTSPAVVEEPARPATLDRAVEVVLGTVRPLGPALVPLPSVRGLVLAEKATAEHDLPTSTNGLEGSPIGVERAAR